MDTVLGFFALFCRFICDFAGWSKIDSSADVSDLEDYTICYECQNEIPIILYEIIK